MDWKFWVGVVFNAGSVWRMAVNVQSRWVEMRPAWRSVTLTTRIAIVKHGRCRLCYQLGRLIECGALDLVWYEWTVAGLSLRLIIQNARAPD
ncbi:hypothetical protein EMGBS1_06760 [Chloroflexota bacterium]|nr:hypothetical protein EMGBS1_06760 [Chloroflexota bacterium]GBL37901.1 hypothetical protein EMGBD1_15880 [Anaerolineaceae bacterium]